MSHSLIAVMRLYIQYRHIYTLKQCLKLLQSFQFLLFIVLDEFLGYMFFLH